jgi:uncharacterized membrane protein
MHTFSAGDAMKYGWQSFKKRPWFFIGATAIVLVVSSIGSTISQNLQNQGIFALLGTLISVGISTLIDMGFTNLTLRAHDSSEAAKLEDLWHSKPFWKFFFASILSGLAVGIGIILLIVPGVILALMFLFVKYIVIDRELGPIEALKESRRITAGHKWQLFELLIIILLVNILGLVCLFVGLLVSIPVSTLAIVHAYRTLGGHGSAPMSA